MRQWLHRFAPALLALLAGLLGVAGLIPRPAATPAKPAADYVIIVGVAGLRWDDVNATDTPAMWQMAQGGAIGALSVRSARRITCAGDGWLTLGAGNLAVYTPGAVTPVCPELEVPITRDGGTRPGSGATLPDQSETVSRNRNLHWGAQPGALAEGVRCTTAIGPGAAIAAARPYGRVDKYAESLDDSLLDACALTLVDVGEIAGNDPVARAADARHADAALANVLAARPEHSVVVLAGLSDLDATSRLHVAIAQGPGYTGGWLTSPSTSRPGYIQVVDLAPTALALLDRPMPVFAGAAAATSDSGRPADVTAAVNRLADADREASVQRRVGTNFFQTLVVAQLLLFLAVVPLLRRARRPAGPQTRRPVPRTVVRAAEVLLIAASLAVPAALVADLLPWWRWPHPGLAFGGITLAVMGFATFAIAFLTRRSRAIAPLGGVAAVAALAVAFDVLTGSRLQLNGVAGYSAVVGGRYAGVGVIGLGLLVTGALLGGAALAQRFERRWRPFVMAVIGAVGMVVIGSPYLGADASGAVALTAGVCVAAAMAVGGWLTITRLVWAAAAALFVGSGFAILDLFRPEEQRSSVGRLLVRTKDGTAGFIARRIAEADVVTTVTSPLTALVLGCLLYATFVLLRDWGGLRRLLGVFSPVRAALTGLVVACLLAGVVEGVSFNVLGAALATALPLVVLSCLRVLEHADDRTPAPRVAEETLES
ncbi:hypothetical protein [Dactylosporangium matsuzakiense]|uniref:Uncharacterized protein n=1 Tax=Dactylosporangium matsuzakiense TaxID=53360 RepID=A0A9W6KNP2_9ACTN|nr:hypothetical protein [Dactylosporangium matsuzakiense]UWZ42932.1 hypothetical protein Dmats_36265 [Dactylosporangium matsuzakiense]GLL03934.1 hypothetical protein GCM10017581_056800 [Dactylosporangium matsuzakiense]